jgi:DNA-binding transcriptional MerR regulator
MKYTIKQVAQRTNLSEHTLRYYDRQGLLPLLKKSKSGIRIYSENDIDCIDLIKCLKSSNMSLANIRKFMSLCLQGEETCEVRRVLLENQRKAILDQLETLNKSLCTINWKLDHYKEIGNFK